MKRLQNEMYDTVKELQNCATDAAIQLDEIRKLKNTISEISGNNKSVDKVKEELQNIANQLEMFVGYTANIQSQLRTYAAQVGDEDE